MFSKPKKTEIESHNTPNFRFGTVGWQEITDSFFELQLNYDFGVKFPPPPLSSYNMIQTT